MAARIRCDASLPLITCRGVHELRQQLCHLVEYFGQLVGLFLQLLDLLIELADLLLQLALLVLQPIVQQRALFREGIELHAKVPGRPRILVELFQLFGDRLIELLQGDGRRVTECVRRVGPRLDRRAGGYQDKPKKPDAEVNAFAFHTAPFALRAYIVPG